MATSISAILLPCLKSFNQLHELVERSDYRYEGEVSSVSWGDQLGRLRIWAANIGAHQTGQSSLDFRLRDASHISIQIKNLLRDLDESLKNVSGELSEDGTKAFEDDETSAAWPDDDSATELQQLHEEIVNIIDCLYQLSMLVRKPAQHDLLIGSLMGDKAEFEFYDNEHVRNLHPRTEVQICQRLGRAITRRRKYLNYRERHHRKLEKGIEEVQRTTGSVMSETVATDFKTHNIEFEETSSNLTQTSYAPSLIDGGRGTIPPPPRESAGGKPFECPYCFFIIDIKSTRSWTRHIFKDIRPYVCTFADCRTSDRLYDSRREWFFHETTEHHRVAFVCSLCKDTLNSSNQYKRHVARHLEELALFALPRTEMDDVEDDDNDAFAQASQGDAVLIGFLGGLNHPDLATKAGEEILPQSDDSDVDDPTEVDRREQTDENIQGDRNLDLVQLAENVLPLVERSIGHDASKTEQLRPAPDEVLTLPNLPELKNVVHVKERDEIRPTYVRVHIKHVSPETLDEYDLPWEYDEREPNYMIITRWVPEQELNILFEHSKNLRLRELRTHSKEQPTRDWDGDKPPLVGIQPSEQRDQRERNMDDLPLARPCNHTSWKGVESETYLLQWNCSFCNSTGHWFIFECRDCGRKACQQCSLKTHS